MQYKHRPEPEYYEWDESWEEDWLEALDEFRAEYMPRSAGRTFEDVEEEYRYGWGARKRKRYSGDWTAVEPYIRREWEENQAETGRSWEDVRDNVRRGWEKSKPRQEE